MFLIVLGSVVCTMSQPTPQYYGPVYHTPAVYNDVPSPYTYQYGVHDHYSGAEFAAVEAADGAGNVEGSYSVALPDGRTQSVTYHADDYTGYVADVQYDGVPQYAALHATPLYHAAHVYPTQVYHG